MILKAISVVVLCLCAAYALIVLLVHIGMPTWYFWVLGGAGWVYFTGYLIEISKDKKDGTTNN